MSNVFLDNSIPIDNIGITILDEQIKSFQPIDRQSKELHTNNLTLISGYWKRELLGVSARNDNHW